MAEVAGPSILLDKALPTGIDYTRLAEFKFQDGVSYQELVSMLSLAIGDVNENMVAKWGWLFSLTHDIQFEYTQGGAVTPMPELTDDTRPKPTKGQLIGHMVDSHAYGDAIAGSRKYWQRARAKKVMADIKTIVQRGIWRFEQNLLSRFFDSDEIAVGAAGYNVPFVHGTGGTIDFAPFSYDGRSFTTSHDHFIGYNLSTPKTMADVLNGLASTLLEHGHKPPYKALVSDTDKALFLALTKIVNWVQIPGLITTGNTSIGAFVQQHEVDYNHFADFQSDSGIINLISTARLATGYVGMGKSYGQLDVRNPLAVFTYPGQPFGMQIVPETAINDDVPIKQLDIEFEFGVAVGEDLTNGAVGFLVAGGSYTDGTIS